VTQVLYQGAVKRVELAMANGGRLVAAVSAKASVSPAQGSRARAAFPRTALHLMEDA
jgi:hypothetical protein